jgi:hypothetical protein
MVCGSCLYVLWALSQDKSSIAFGEAVTVQNESVQKLPTSERHYQPAAEPPWLAVTPNVARIRQGVISKFETA